MLKALIPLHVLFHELLKQNTTVQVLDTILMKNKLTQTYQGYSMNTTMY